jgi:hypothetical protein
VKPEVPSEFGVKTLQAVPFQYLYVTVPPERGVTMTTFI